MPDLQHVLDLNCYLEMPILLRHTYPTVCH